MVELDRNVRMNNIVNQSNSNEKDEIISFKIDQILDLLLQDKDLVSVKLYKAIVFDFIKNHVCEDILHNGTDLMRVIRAYLVYLTNKEVGMDTLLYLFRSTRTPDNEIKRVIMRTYINSRTTLIKSCELFRLDCRDNDIVERMLEMYQDHSTMHAIFGNIYLQCAQDPETSIEKTKQVGELLHALDTILLIKANSTIVDEIEKGTRVSSK